MAQDPDAPSGLRLLVERVAELEADLTDLRSAAGTPGGRNTPSAAQGPTLAEMAQALTPTLAAMGIHPGLCESPECTPCRSARAVYGDEVRRRAQNDLLAGMEQAAQFDGPDAMGALAVLDSAVERWTVAGKPRTTLATVAVSRGSDITGGLELTIPG